ncbi:hypothetical protein EIP86_006689 [Pleurotus ostreatoroseus]|nr:hypothetical protein EIP86_006689 [Pleurotus ostreatoroseus]
MSDVEENEEYEPLYYCAYRDCETTSLDERMIACERCAQVRYCSPRCRRRAWPYHVFECLEGRAHYTAIQYLALSCYYHQIPSHARTRRWFLFDRVKPYKMETQLLGLYEALIDAVEAHTRLDIDEIEEWVGDDVFLEKAADIFETHGVSGSALLSYRWLQRNRWVFDESLPVPDVPQ